MKKLRKLNFNYIIADIVSQMNIGMLRKLRFIQIVRTKIALRILTILYKQGVIRTFKVNGSYINIYFKYKNGQPICSKLSIVSKPSKRERWKLTKLVKHYSILTFLDFILYLRKKD